jgi:hypothetical protein
MNDFTKDELEEILGCVNSIIAINKESKDYFGPLAYKTEAMIDNYCEHEWKNHCPECNPLNIYCIKCREYLRDNNKIDLSTV